MNLSDSVPYPPVRGKINYLTYYTLTQHRTLTSVTRNFSPIHEAVLQRTPTGYPLIPLISWERATESTG
jgi:hypothetical protein